MPKKIKNKKNLFVNNKQQIQKVLILDIKDQIREKKKNKKK